jgi:Flp pilus assembly protein TadG
MRTTTRARIDCGQALPEFALVAIPLFMILFGIIQLGFLFGGQNGLTNAAREAARYASTLPTPDAVVAGNNRTLVLDRLINVNLKQYVPGYQSGKVTMGGSTDVCYFKQAVGSEFSIHVRVKVLYRHPLFIPLIGNLFSSSNEWALGATEDMRVEGPNRTAATAAAFSATPC